MAPIKHVAGSNQYKKIPSSRVRTPLHLDIMGWYTADERSKIIAQRRAERKQQTQQRREQNINADPAFWNNVYHQTERAPLNEFTTDQMVKKVLQQNNINYTFDEHDQMVVLAMQNRDPLTLSYKKGTGSLGWSGIECTALALIVTNPQEQWSAPTLSAVLDSVALNTNIEHTIARSANILQKLESSGFLYAIPPEIDMGRDYPVYVPRSTIEPHPFTDSACSIPHCLAALRDGPANITQLSQRLQTHGYQPTPTSPKILTRLCSYAKKVGFLNQTNEQYKLADGVEHFIPSF